MASAFRRTMNNELTRKRKDPIKRSRVTAKLFRNSYLEYVVAVIEPELKSQRSCNFAIGRCATFRQLAKCRQRGPG
jgi:hypothetical protein